MSQMIPLVDVLADKKGPRKEAHLILFEYCNLRCSFCHQDHTSNVGMDTQSILDKVSTLIASTDPTTPYVVNMTGGELFLDEIPDDFFDTYLIAGTMILQHFDDVKLVYGTNLVYQNVERVEKLIWDLRGSANSRSSVVLATSYDPAGRFNSADRELFFKNLGILQGYIETVNVVITRQNVDMFLKGIEGAEVAEMVEKFDVYFDHYIPSTLFEDHQPSEEHIGKLYLKLNETYPNSYPIKGWKEGKFNETTCRSTKIVNKDGVVTTCWSEAGKDSILDENEGLLAKNAAEERFLQKYNCFACEYYTRCGLRCFLHHSFVEDGSDECQIKVMFDAIL